MSMLDSLSTVASSTVHVALDALALRQQLISTNLANANSAQYGSYRIDFEQALQREVDSSATRSPAETLESLRSLRGELSSGAHIKESASAAVEIDQEMIRLNETVIRYQALIQGLGKYGSLARMAISGEVKP